MGTTKAITIALLSLFTWSNTYSQEILKVKPGKPGKCKAPKVKVLEREGVRMVTSKDFDGYHKVKKQYYYDNDRELYYFLNDGHRIYYE